MGKKNVLGPVGDPKLQPYMGDPNSQSATIDPFASMGVTGLRRHSEGFSTIDEEWLADLRGSTKGIKAFREISDNAAVVNSVLFLMDSFVRQLKWECDAADDSPEAQELAEYVEGCIEDLAQSWPNLIGEICRNVVIYGWDTHELIYKRRKGNNKDPMLSSIYEDGKIGWAKIAPRSCDSRYAWQFSETGEVLGLYQLAPPSYQMTYIPIQKLLLTTSVGTTKENPEGRSCLRGCYVSYYMLKRIQQSECIGVSRNLQGVPKMQVPLRVLSQDATTDEKALLENFQVMVSRMKADEYAGIVIPSEVSQDGNPSGYKFELMQTGSTGKAVETTAIIERLERAIARAFLADWLYLGSGSGSAGSWSLASVRTHGFAQALGGFLASIVDSFNENAIPQLMRLNGVHNAESYPKLRHGDLEAQPIEEIAPHMVSLVSAGLVTPDDETEAWLREILGAPQSDKALESQNENEEEEIPVEPTDEPTMEAEAEIKPEGTDEGESEIETGGAHIEAVTLNGAQVTSLIQVIQQVVSGLLPRDSALNLIVTAFNVPAKTADRILGDVGRSFKPESQDETPAPEADEPLVEQLQDEVEEKGFKVGPFENNSPVWNEPEPEPEEKSFENNDPYELTPAESNSPIRNRGEEEK